jgi:hypothetical protein
VDFHAGAQKKPQKPQRTGEGSVEKMESPCKQHAKNRMLCFDVMKKSSWTHTHTHTHTYNFYFILFYFINTQVAWFRIYRSTSDPSGASAWYVSFWV